MSPWVGAPDASDITFDVVIDEMRARAPEFTQARAVRLANWRLTRMVGRADYKRKVTELTTTVADQAAYDLPTSVIDVRRAWIGDNRYDWISYDEMVEVEQDRQWVNTSDGRTGVVTVTEDSSGDSVLRFYPAPEATGDSITIEESFQSTDVAYGSSATTVLPAHIVPYWAEGCYAEAYAASARLDLAEVHEQRYEEGTELLRRFKNTRGGSGPRRIRLTR